MVVQLKIGLHFNNIKKSKKQNIDVKKCNKNVKKLVNPHGCIYHINIYFCKRNK